MPLSISMSTKSSTGMLRSCAARITASGTVTEMIMMAGFPWLVHRLSEVSSKGRNCEKTREKGGKRLVFSQMQAARD